MTEGAVDALVRRLMMQNVVTMRERATLDILAGEADVNAFLEERAECHGFAHCPIDALGVDHLLARGQDTQQAAMDDEFGCVRWWRRETIANVDQGFFLDTSRGGLHWVFAFEEAGPRRIQPILVLFCVFDKRKDVRKDFFKDFMVKCLP